jgi:hypothetical protein
LLQYLRHLAGREGQPDNGVPAQETSRPPKPRRRRVTPSVHAHVRRTPGAAPNGGPATRLGNSGITEGPPSVS